MAAVVVEAEDQDLAEVQPLPRHLIPKIPPLNQKRPRLVLGHQDSGRVLQQVLPLYKPDLCFAVVGINSNIDKATKGMPAGELETMRIAESGEVGGEEGQVAVVVDSVVEVLREEVVAELVEVV